MNNADAFEWLDEFASHFREVSPIFNVLSLEKEPAARLDFSISSDERTFRLQHKNLGHVEPLIDKMGLGEIVDNEGYFSLSVGSFMVLVSDPNVRAHFWQKLHAGFLSITNLARVEFLSDPLGEVTSARCVYTFLDDAFEIDGRAIADALPVLIREDYLLEIALRTVASDFKEEVVTFKRLP